MTKGTLGLSNELFISTIAKLPKQYQSAALNIGREVSKNETKTKQDKINSGATKTNDNSKGRVYFENGAKAGNSYQKRAVSLAKHIASAINSNGQTKKKNKKTPHCLVCTVVQNTEKAEGYVFRDIENVTINHGLPITNNSMPEPVNNDTYTISQLYQFVKGVKREDGGLKYSPAEKSKYLFAYTKRNDGVLY